MTPVTSATPVRTTSRRRIARSAATASSAPPERRATATASASSEAWAGGTSRSSDSNSAAVVGARSMRAPSSRPEASTSANRSAAPAESRSILRYQWVLPSSSEIRRNDSSPASGSAASANIPSMAGSRVRWIAARRLTPPVSASMCRSAPAGSR